MSRQPTFVSDDENVTVWPAGTRSDEFAHRSIGAICAEPMRGTARIKTTHKTRVIADLDRVSRTRRPEDRRHRVTQDRQKADRA
jgi:hypothetical protein